MANEITIRDIAANGYTFRCRTCGLENAGDLVIFLHGFPECSLMWRDILPVMANKGYRVLAPDQRGYSPKARPQEIGEYTVRKLSTDVIRLAEAVGGENVRFHLVGHDWGCTVGWVTVSLFPERVISWTAMSNCYPKDYYDVMFNYPPQRKMSQYVFDFCEPDAEEKLMADGGYGGIVDYWHALPSDMLEEYKRVFNCREAFFGALGWYRAWTLQALKRGVYETVPIPLEGVELPTLTIRGLYDPYVGPEGFSRTHRYMLGEYTFMQLKAGHWLMETVPEMVVPPIVRHIEAHRTK